LQPTGANKLAIRKACKSGLYSGGVKKITNQQTDITQVVIYLIKIKVYIKKIFC
jgi:hypothetical protein